MGVFSKRKIGPELALIFNIRSSSVGGALFEINKLGIPKIIFSIREPIIFEDKIDIDRFLFLTSKSLETVASRICLAGFRRPSSIFCILSSPWYASQTRIIRLEKNAPFLFTSKLADSLMEKEVSFFKEESSAKFSHSYNKMRPIEFKNMKVMLNGYATSTPFNKKVRKLEMIVFISMGEDKVLKKIEGIISKHFHTEKVRFSSFAMASFAVTRDLFLHQNDFLLIDISGEMTDISMIKKGVLSHSISYPLGYHFMIREVADSLGCSLSEAKSLISLHKDGHALQSSVKKLESVISKLKTAWLKGFQESLINLSDDISVPTDIFMTADKGLTDFFGNVIKTEQFSQYNLTESEFRIIFLNAETLHGLAAFSDNVSRDPFIILESVYINRFLC